MWGEEDLAYCRSCGAAVARNASFCSECGVRSPGVKNPLSTFDEPPLQQPRASAAPRRRGSQGLILGVVGSCFGVLGIFTLGLIFVPLAILSSLFGLLRGLANQSTAGTGMSIVGLTLSAIGFFSSPSLMLLAGGLLVAGQTSTPSSKEVQSASSAVDENERLPLQERRFCEINSSASAKYAGLARDAKKARDDKNGILEKRAEEAMTSTARDRNADIFKLVQESSFKFEKWGVELLTVGSPNDKRVTFSVRPLCSDIVTIHITASPNGPLLETLAAKRKGDAFLVSGTFVGSRAGSDAPPTLPDAKRFEVSITERGSMQEPEYWALLR
jgi:hypothetical protein